MYMYIRIIIYTIFWLYSWCQTAVSISMTVSDGRPGLSGSWITQKPSFAKASTAVAVNWARDSMLPGCLVVGGAITILKNSQWVKDDIPYMKNIQFMFETTNQMSTNLYTYPDLAREYQCIIEKYEKKWDVSLSSCWLNLTWFIPDESRLSCVRKNGKLANIHPEKGCDSPAHPVSQCLRVCVSS